MSWTRDPALSLRENIAEYWRWKLERIEPGVDGYLIGFDSVVRAPLTKPEHLLRAAAGVIDFREEKRAEIGYYLCTLFLNIEFCVATPLGEQPASALNRALLDIQRCFFSDQTSGGLAYDVREVMSEIQPDSDEDRLGLGVVQFQILYRHRIDDPRKLVGE